jgi:hypothetical protein
VGRGIHKYMKPKVNVVKFGKQYRVRFNIGVQYFYLDVHGDKIHMQWFAKMLRKAFKKIK